MNAHTQLPKTVRLPGGYSVDVRISERKTCRRCRGEHLEEDDDAEYGRCNDEPVISIWRGLTPRQRWRKLTHEMLHALADYELWVEQRVSEKAT